MRQQLLDSAANPTGQPNRAIAPALLAARSPPLKSPGRRPIARAAALFVVWVGFPPFAASTDLKSMTLAQLKARDGELDVDAPDKFVAWYGNRDIGSWVLEVRFVNFPVPSIPEREFNERAFRVSRKFCLQFGGIGRCFSIDDASGSS